MKKLLFAFLAFLALLVAPSVAFGQENTAAIDIAVEQAVDTFEDVRLSKLQTTAQIQLVTDIVGAIDVLKQQDRYMEDGLYAAVLDSLRRALVDLLDEIGILLSHEEANNNNSDNTDTNGGSTTTTTTTYGFPETTTTSQ